MKAQVDQAVDTWKIVSCPDCRSSFDADRAESPDRPYQEPGDFKALYDKLPLEQRSLPRFLPVVSALLQKLDGDSFVDTLRILEVPNRVQMVQIALSFGHAKSRQIADRLMLERRMEPFSNDKMPKMFAFDLYE